MKTALLSVSNKEGIVEFAKKLEENDWYILSTGGTFNILKENNVKVTQVSDITNFPEMLDGRVKTLHPAIHGGILAKRNKKHLSELEKFNIKTIDLVCVNLYPFKETVEKNADFEEIIENIDIGGPAMIRSAAKNHESVFILVDPKDYQIVFEEESKEKRKYLAAKAYKHTSDYDKLIYNYLGIESQEISFIKEKNLRYGENPHQIANLYRINNQNGAILDSEILSGKEMSFNNYLDAQAAYNLLRDLGSMPCCVAVKHGNPCGVAQKNNILDAWQAARDADTLSIFGGVVAINQKLDLMTAKDMQSTFLEVLIVPEIELDALEFLKNKKPNLRIVKTRNYPTNKQDFKFIDGGLLIQDNDLRKWDDLKLEVVTKTNVSEEQLKDAMFAWSVVKNARSNAIVVAKNQVTQGIGAGAVSRIWAAQRAFLNMKEKGGVIASEAFFPFSDVVELAAQYDIKAIIQPGGSVRDQEVIAKADELSIAMIFTGSRHFKH